MHDVTVYQAEGVPVTILQRRAPHLNGHSAAFASELIAWIKAAGFAQVLVVTGADAGYRSDAQLSGFVSHGACPSVCVCLRNTISGMRVVCACVVCVCVLRFVFALCACCACVLRRWLGM